MVYDLTYYNHIPPRPMSAVLPQQGVIQRLELFVHDSNTHHSLTLLLSWILPISSSLTLLSSFPWFTVIRWDFLSLITCKCVEFYSDF